MKSYTSVTKEQKKINVRDTEMHFFRADAPADTLSKSIARGLRDSAHGRVKKISSLSELC